LAPQLGLLARKVLIQDLFDDDCLVVVLVSRPVHGGDGAVPRSGEQRREDVRVRLELVAIALLELGPAARVMAEPLAQPRAGAGLLEPRLDLQIGPCAATRPQAIDEEAPPIIGGRWFIRALELDHPISLALDVLPLAASRRPVRFLVAGAPVVSRRSFSLRRASQVAPGGRRGGQLRRMSSRIGVPRSARGTVARSTPVGSIRATQRR
jgi:hypothetical protein